MKALAQIEPTHFYVFVRSDISLQQQAVQAVHAAYQLGNEYSRPDFIPSLVLLSVSNLDELLNARQICKDNGFKHHLFYENDIDAFTSLAVEPLSVENKKVFSTYRLWKG